MEKQRQKENFEISQNENAFTCGRIRIKKMDVKMRQDIFNDMYLYI